MELLKQTKKPCILLTADGNGRMQLVGGGTLSELKSQAHLLLRKCNYIKTYYIVRKDRYITCNGEIKKQAKTSRKTDDKTLVLELGKYAYLGVAPE